MSQQPGVLWAIFPYLEPPFQTQEWNSVLFPAFWTKAVQRIPSPLK
jgi:hypothetical protein